MAVRTGLISPVRLCQGVDKSPGAHVCRDQGLGSRKWAWFPMELELLLFPGRRPSSRMGVLEIQGLLGVSYTHLT